jgi:signal transduction histidine kinase
LGKLAANLSHELNNPASAAQRAAQSLASTIDRDQELCRLGRLFSSEDELSKYLEWTKKSLAMMQIQGGAAAEVVSLAESDREEEFVQWLEEHRVPNAWSVAPAFARTKLPLSALDELSTLINSAILPVAVASFSTSLNTRSLVGAVSESSARIFHIIDAIRDYSYMDQSPIQEIDLATSLENALALLGARLKEMVVVRDFDDEVPAITGYGAELSQVWTALIENAIDATNGTGTLRLTTRLKGEMAFVEVWDDGVGIEPSLSTRIFEPFFTTKPLGQALGLGLDTVRTIVGKHFGSVTVESVPRSTSFQVLLPLDRPQID